MYLELEGGRSNIGGDSPPSDNVLFDNQCYATTPSSSNGNSDLDQPTHSRGSTYYSTTSHFFYNGFVLFNKSKSVIKN